MSLLSNEPIWEEIATMPSEMTNNVPLCYLGSKIYHIGGGNPRGRIYEYDVLNDQYQQVAEMENKVGR